MAKRFVGKTALVTGGSRGIGKEIVEGLIQAGAKVFALGKSQGNLTKLKSEIPTVEIIQVDIADWNATKRAVEKIGVVDFLVNNAGVLSDILNFVDTTQTDFEETININCKAAFNISQVVARGLIAAGRPGSIVNISSIAGMKGFVGESAYCISKAMMEMLTKVMALELGHHGIRVNNVNPTGVRTDMTEELFKNETVITEFIKTHPMGKVAEAKDVVDATLFLLGEESSMITGSSLPVDGGLMVY